MDEDEPIEHKLITRSVEKAQKKVEARNFDIRKHVLQFDDVMNQQREVIYGQRHKILSGDSMKENIFDMVEQIIDEGMEKYTNEKVYPEDWDTEGMEEYCKEYFLPANRLTPSMMEKLSFMELREELLKIANDLYTEKEQAFGETNMRELEKIVMLKVVDSKWMEHLDNMDIMREGIGLRAYGQRDPLVEYKIEAFDMFQGMIKRIQHEVVRFMFRVTIAEPAEEGEQQEV